MKFDLSTLIINDLVGDGDKPHMDGDKPMTLGALLAQVIMMPQSGGVPHKEAMRRKKLAKSFRLNGSLSIDTTDRALIITLAEAGSFPVFTCAIVEAFEPEAAETKETSNV